MTNDPATRTLLPGILGRTEDPDEQTATAYTAIAADPAVRKLAVRCKLECEALIRQGGYEHFIAATVMGSAMRGCTPAEWLEHELELIRSESAALKVEAARASARRQKETARIAPLSREIGKRSANHIDERLALIKRVQLSDGARSSTWRALRDAGLTDAEIEAKGVEPTIATVQGWKARIGVIERELEAFAKWGADPFRNVDVLQGVPGLDQYLPAATKAELERA